MDSHLQKYDLHVWWSIYVKTKDMGKAKREHFPLIESVIGEPAVHFEYRKEEGGLYRLVAWTNLPDTDVKTAVNRTLSTAFELADGWRIYGLGCLTSGRYRHVTGLWSVEKPSHRPPQLESMMFQIDRGLAKSMDERNAVQISEFDPSDGLEDDVDNRFRLRPSPIAEQN